MYVYINILHGLVLVFILLRTNKNQAKCFIRSVYEYWLTFLSDSNTEIKMLSFPYVYLNNAHFLLFWLLFTAKFFFDFKFRFFVYKNTARTHFTLIHITLFYIYYYDFCDKTVIASNLVQK